MAETAAVKKEVQHLQQQLEIEREAAAAKWQQVRCFMLVLGITV